MEIYQWDGWLGEGRGGEWESGRGRAVSFSGKSSFCRGGAKSARPPCPRFCRCLVRLGQPRGDCPYNRMKQPPWERGRGGEWESGRVGEGKGKGNVIKSMVSAIKNVRSH
ncbi:MAG: hypothetical protein EAZ68_12960 [Oscillatoriales cyanobacterium]|nr:MAG: hypothetical protein EAZ68_12960 [Oscillatoriales cyanobacterium]